MLTIPLKSQLRNYFSQFSEEAGGVLISNNDKISFYPCQNLSYHKKTHYILSYLDYIEAEKQGKIVAQIHSQENDEPSLLDNISANDFNLYSIIYCWKSDKFYIINPEIKDYLNKDFKIGVNDCFSLVRNYYKDKLNTNLEDYKREENWHINAPTLIYDNIKNNNFETVDDLKINDILLFGKNEKELYHLAIYQGNNLILHHPRESKSVVEDLSNHLKNKLILTIRHKSLL